MSSASSKAKPGTPLNSGQSTRYSLLHHWGRDIQLWAYITLTLLLFRLALISVFFEQANPNSDFTSLLAVIGNGLRYDISTAGAWVLPTFLLSLTLLNKRVGDGWLSWLRGWSARVYVFVAFIIFGVDLIYFDEYGDQFDNHIFGIVHDDTQAILITIWKEYHPLIFLTIVTPLIFVNLFLIKRWLGTDTQWHLKLSAIAHPTKRVIAGIIVFLFVAAMVRGGTLSGEPIRLKHAFIVEDMFLNRAVLNPFSALRYTIKTRLALETGSALKQYWPSEDLKQAINMVRQERGQAPYEGNSIEEGLTVTSKGGSGSKPKHIFLMLMESHSGWTVMPSYRHFGLSPEFSKLADEGIYFPNFVPSASGTIGSMNALITGFPHAGLNINYEPTALKPYGSSIAKIMKELGYKTRFFYGGFLSWQRLDSFAKNQGFDEVYGGGSMSANTDTNEWGVDDKYLYDFILNTVDKETPSFNFILSTSNHPPFDLPLDELGYHIKGDLPAPLKATKKESVKVLGHLWYADKVGGEFVRRAEKQLPDALFAITGDHSARLQIKFPGDSVVEQPAVPFILYGPDILKENGTRKTAGSHIDILPTLIDMAATENYRYPTYGKNLLHHNSPSIGFGWQYLIGEEFIANDSKEYGVFALAGAERPDEKPQLGEAMQQYNALRALSWQRIKKGPNLP